MSVVFEVCAGEVLIASEEVPSPSAVGVFPFGWLVTDKAIYVPTSRNGMHPLEPLEARRVAIERVRTVALTAASQLTVSLAFFAGALCIFSWSALQGLERGVPVWHVVGLPVVFLAAVGRVVRGTSGRFRLTIVTDAATFEFTPSPTAVPSAVAKAKAYERQHTFVEACRRVGINIAAQAQGPGGPA